ncbi:NADP-dependent isocitrate dehydrogenase [Oligoflexaceae bacterium]|nr:NADP-dependent isocitrate dehydrogenase [Oligoflexaceae bacterium]
MQKTPITLAYGDGIGPEIMKATLRILEAAGAQLEFQTIEVGEKVFEKGIPTGIEPSAWESLRKTKVFLKSPITTPQGKGYKSLNVTIRKSLGLFANVRPCVAYAPFVDTKHPNMNLVVIRENEEDTYAGIEYQQTAEVAQCLKLISQPGCERIVRYAFEYARRFGRKKVTCLVKDNIMKITDGLFHRAFQSVAKEYTDIEADSLIVDIGTARLADTPEDFDVVVTLNLYGDIVSDVTAQLAGSVGLAGSSNVGLDCAMFEAIHGSAPPIAGQGVANPSGLINGAVMMLVHIGQIKVAEAVSNALLKTLEDGIHTGDVFTKEHSKEKVGTEAFADAVIERLGKTPKTLPVVSLKEDTSPWDLEVRPKPISEKKLVGVDIFVESREASKNVKDFGDRAATLSNELPFKLTVITNRGVAVYPECFPETFFTDHWRLRFMATEGRRLDHKMTAQLLSAFADSEWEPIKTENLYSFDGEPGFSS